MLNSSQYFFANSSRDTAYSTLAAAEQGFIAGDIESEK
jgi:hypothetical protein